MLLGFSLPTDSPQALNKFPKWIVLQKYPSEEVFSKQVTHQVFAARILQPTKDNMYLWFSEQIAITSQPNLQNSIQTPKGVMYR